MGIITKIFDWGKHPSVDTKTDPKDWALGLVLILAIAFLWSRVIKQIVEA